MGYTKPETLRKYRQTHKKERAALQRAYNQRHKEEVAAKARGYRAAHAEELREYFRAYHEAHREERNAAMRARYAAEPERGIVRSLAWTAGNRERVRQNQRAYGAMRRSTEAGLPATLTPEDWADVLDLFGYKCAYCDKDGKLHQDHFVPVTRGGGYELGNIVPACHSCNSKKNAKDPLVWLGLRRYLDTLETMYAV